MSVVINGIKMPRGEDEGMLIALYDGQAYHIGTKEKHEAIELLPHGRLIDADALKKKHHWTDDYYETEYVEVEDIDSAPTIIPAEEGEA